MDVTEISDIRLAHIYVELVKTYKFKFEVWNIMMKSPDFEVSTLETILKKKIRVKIFNIQGTGRNSNL